ncbi:MAG: hypothetical protein R3B54_16275 [Bdellovibrionota bacterium]
MGTRTIVLLAALVFVGNTFAAQEENVYVKLYETRVELAKILTQKKEQEFKYHLTQLDRQERLYQRKATSAAELEAHQREAKVAELAVDDARMQVREATIMRDIAKERVALGLEMPICPGSPVR